MKIIFNANDEEGDVQELVVERDIGAAPEGPAGDDSASEGLPVQQAVETLLEEAIVELQKNGLDVPEKERSSILIRLALALLNGEEEVELPASLRVVAPPKPSNGSVPQAPKEENL